MKKKKILWLTWKDKKHPLAGGAEIVNEEIAKRLVRDGHEVVFLVGGFENCEKEEVVDGYKIIRLGNRYTLYWKAFRYYKKHFRGWADLVVDEMNTIPFFARFYVKEPVIMFVHQLCREIWFYQFPPVLSWVGYLVEPIYLWLLRKSEVITISDSTKKDLMRYGFEEKNISIISEGIDIDPIEDLNSVEKYPEFTMLSLGAFREMKNTLDQVKAFEIVREKIPELKLKIAGDNSGKYGEKVLEFIEKSSFRDDIEYLGKVSQEKKVELMRKSHFISVTSIKEGWGLIATEANSQGTPAVVYDVDGLRDSVRHQETGIIANENTPNGLMKAIVQVFNDKEEYAKLRENAWKWSREFTFDKCYDDFSNLMKSEK